MKSKIFPIVKSPEEFAIYIQNLSSEEEKYKQIRKDFIKEFVRPINSKEKAGEVAAKIIINFLNEHSF